ncbi:MAG TPA: condensation domain-containing protein, partial [Acidimicrobiales bacterium]|nr:condensation domain-containing protein [Acidimicrobiales bacterium]
MSGDRAGGAGGADRPGDRAGAGGPQAGSPPISVAQEALWYHSALEPGRITYNEAVSIRRDGPLDADVLRRALVEVVRRHAAWRTTFDVVGGRPVQQVG